MNQIDAPKSTSIFRRWLDERAEADYSFLSEPSFHGFMNDEVRPALSELKELKVV